MPSAPDRVAADPAGGGVESDAARGLPFGDRLARVVMARESQLVLGLDPDSSRLWPAAAQAANQAGEACAGPRERAARAVLAHCALVIEAAGEHCVAVKLQLACFERLGGPGWEALRRVTALARKRGLLVIADAKRGDIDMTATAYAEAFFGQTPTPYGPVDSLGVDALTVNPLLGRDSLAPFVDRARQNGAGLFVLVRTSNPGAGEVQGLVLADGASVSDRLAAIVTEIGAAGVGQSGLSDVGAVVGATGPERISDLRERMPRAIFLLPGVGAQGGRVEELAPAFSAGPASALIAASRAIVAAYESHGGDPARAAGQAAQRLRELAWSLTA